MGISIYEYITTTIKEIMGYSICDIYIYILSYYIHIYIYILTYVENQHHDLGLSENDEYLRDDPVQPCWTNTCFGAIGISW